MPGLFPSQRELAYSDRLMADTDAMRQDQRSFLMARQQQQAAAAEMAARERMQGQAIAAEHASQRFAADRRSSDEYNARNDAYSMATDPRLAAIERLRLNEAMGREQALMGTQSANRINEHFEAMQDDRARMTGVANNQARLDSALLMQRGNIDARLQGQQGQNALALHQFDSTSKAEADLRNKEMAIQERNAALMQTGQFSEGDEEYLRGIEEQKQNLRTAKDEKRITDSQFVAGMHSLLSKEAGRMPTQKRVSFGEQFEQSSKTLPDGRIVYNTGKGIGVSNPPAGIKPEMVDPEAKARATYVDRRKAAMDIVKNSGTKEVGGQSVPNIGMDEAMEMAARWEGVTDGRYAKSQAEQQPGSDPQELFRHVQQVNQMATQSGVPVQQYVQQLAEQNPAAAEAYVAGLRMIQQSQGQGQSDPRAGGVKAVTPPRPQPQRMVPGQPGPVDPRQLMMMQGQPAEAPQERPMADPNQRAAAPSPTASRMDAMAQKSLANDDQQTAGALQAFKTITQKYGGLPPSGSEEEQIVMQAAAYLRKRGIDPTGGVRRGSPRTGGPMSQGYLK